MKRIVTLKGSTIDSIDEHVLRECLRIMFPECEIEIQPNQPANGPDEEGHTGSGKDSY